MADMTQAWNVHQGELMKARPARESMKVKSVAIGTTDRCVELVRLLALVQLHYHISVSATI